MWSLGMSENAKLNYKHYLIIIFVLVNILLISLLPIISNKYKHLKGLAKLLGLMFLAVNLFYAIKFVSEILLQELDGGIFTIFCLILFSVAEVCLINKILKL